MATDLQDLLQNFYRAECKPLELFALIAAAQEAAPSFLVARTSEVPYYCTSCGKRDTRPFVKVFTPTGENHDIIHLQCADRSWLQSARYLGSF